MKAGRFLMGEGPANALTAFGVVASITLAACTATPYGEQGNKFTGSLDFGDKECPQGSVNKVDYKIPNQELARQVAGQLYTDQTAGLNLSEYEESTISTKTGAVIIALSDLIENQARQDFVNGYNAMIQAADPVSLGSGLEAVAMPELRAAITENFSSLKVGAGEIDRDVYAQLGHDAIEAMNERIAQTIHRGLAANHAGKQNPCESDKTMQYGVGGPVGTAP